MRTRLLAVVVLAVLAGMPSAHAQSGPRDAAIEGRVVADDGSPVRGADVVVRRSPGIAEQIGDMFAFAFTAGLACVAGDDVCDQRTGVRARTVADAGGAFRLPLGREYTPGSESDTDFFVTASVPARDGQLSGPATTEEFEVAQEVQTSPELLLWTPELETTMTPTVAAATWDTLDASRFDDDVVEHQLRYLTPAGATLASLHSSGDRVDARVLEDATGVISLVARGDITVGPTIYHQTHDAPRVAFSGAAGAPPSRGRQCAGDGALLAGCPLTDGNLEAPLRPPCVDATGCPAELTSVIVDLGDAIEIGLVVVRACDRCTVATSTDDVTYVELAGEGLARPTARPVRARYVRLTSSPMSSLEQTAELSVWPASARDDGIQSDGTTTTGDADGPVGRSIVPFLVAAVLAAFVGRAAWNRRAAR